MKRLFTIFLSSILVTGSWGSVPMAILGDVYNAGPMKSQGAVHVKISGTDKAGRVYNNGTLNVESDSIIFYSDNSSDGLLMNEGDISASQVAVRKIFKENIWYMMAFPFDVELSSGVRNALDGTKPEKGPQYDVQFYDAKRRAFEGKNEDKNWQLFSDPTLIKGAAYRIAVDPGEVLSIPGEGAYIDFVAKTSQDITNLFDITKKGVDLTYEETPAGKFTDKTKGESEGWNAFGGLNSSRYIISSGTVNYNKEAVYYREPGFTWWQINPEFETGTLRPYSVIFVQTSTNEESVLKYAEGGGFQYLGNGVTLGSDPDNIIFRSSENAKPYVIANKHITNTFRSPADNSYDVVRLQITDNKSNYAYVYFKFNNGYSKFYKSTEDNIIIDTKHPVRPVVWALAPVGDEFQQLFIDCLPKGENEVALGFSVPAGGEYIFSLEEFTNETISSVFLKDKENGVTTNMLTDTYSFQSNGVSNNENRFVIYFNSKNVTSITPALPEASDIYAYTVNNVLTVKNLLPGDKVQIMDLTGRIITAGTAYDNTFSVTLNQKGVYIINARGDKTLKVLNK